MKTIFQFLTGQRAGSSVPSKTLNHRTDLFTDPFIIGQRAAPSAKRRNATMQGLTPFPFSK